MAKREQTTPLYKKAGLKGTSLCPLLSPHETGRESEASSSMELSHSSHTLLFKWWELKMAGASPHGLPRADHPPTDSADE